MLRAPPTQPSRGSRGRGRGGFNFPIHSSHSVRELFFNSSTCHSTWRGTQVTVTLSFPSHPDGTPGKPHFSVTSTTLVLGNNHLLTTYLSDDLGDALVSLEVVFTGSLQTCSLFQALAYVGHAAPAPGSATEPSVPQARIALRTLEQSLKTGTSFDIVFQAYTRRLSPGNVARPIQTCASTTVLHETTLLPDFSKEDLEFSSLFELFEGDNPPFTSECYEYESDSDLDDEECENLTAVQPAEELPTGGKASPCHDQQSHSSAPDAQPHKDMTSGGSRRSSFSSFEAASSSKERPNIRTPLLEEAEVIPNQNMKSGSRVVLVKGVAWKTWHAFVYYCYSGIIKFSGLRSQAATTAVTFQQHLHCSPKSMYQLAKKLNNDVLSQLAFKAIETRLSPANILDEAFSKFTARHDDVREMEIALLVRYRSAPDVLQGLPAKIEAMAMGTIPHAKLVLTAFFQRIVQMPKTIPDVVNVNDQ